jgi:DNA-3-methyladenine glycosylase I
MPKQPDRAPDSYPNDKPRCAWCLSHPLYVAYHDDEWGVPEHDDRKLFEMLILEGAQAGLSWLTVLKKREGYARAFAEWDVKRVARFNDTDRARLLADASIIRNRLKIDSAITNAKHFIEVAEEFGSFDRYVWRFTEGKTLRAPHPPERLEDIPAVSPESHAMSKDLKRRGFRFVGPTICYAHMQACGMVDDHLLGCFKCVEPRCR